MVTSIFKSDAGVSESVGLILISLILVLSFGIIFAVGYPVYNKYIDDGHMRNMEESFYILSYNGNTVAMKKAPFSSSEVKMYGGVLSTNRSGSMNISYHDVASGATLYNNTTLTVLEYRKDQDKIAYVAGGVFGSGNSGSFMLKEPEIYSSPGSLFFPLITLYNSEISIAGNGLTRVHFLTPYYSKMAQMITAPGTARFNVDRVDITIDSEYAGAFSRFFQDDLGFTESPPGPNGETILSKTYPGGVDLYISQFYLMVQAV